VSTEVVNARIELLGLPVSYLPKPSTQGVSMASTANEENTAPVFDKIKCHLVVALNMLVPLSSYPRRTSRNEQIRLTSMFSLFAEVCCSP
jgi:hypothetical protein